MRWKYDGYTKVKVGSGRRAKYVENRIYICPDCGYEERIEAPLKPPRFCPNCKSDMKEGVEHE